MNIEELDVLKELSEQTYFGDLPFLYYADLIGKLLTDYKQKCNYIKENEIYKKNLLNLIEKQSKEIEELKNTETYKLAIIDKDKYISKDKIKAKIEELDYNDIGNFERRCKQEVLQSLLEKE